MSTRSESAIVHEIVRWLRARAVYVDKTHGDAVEGQGRPDLIGCAVGRYFAFEVKKPETKGHTTAMQRYVLQEITLAGGIAAVVTSVEEVNEQLRSAGIILSVTPTLGGSPARD